MFEGIVDSGSRVLSLLILLPLAGSVVLFAVPAAKERLARWIAIGFGVVEFALSICMLVRFDSGSPAMQLTERLSWIPNFGVNYVLGVDGLSVYLIALTTFLTLLVLIASTSIHERLRSYLGFMLLLETGMIGTFLALDAITFYVFWELMLVPMYFLIGIWGHERRIYAALKFVLYTALGSLLMLVAIIYLGFSHYEQFGDWSFFIGDWTKLQFTLQEQMWLFAAFAIAFAIKIPIFPFHTWLPDAHVEAPTGGSVILAGILLKMGLYGLLRFGLPVFPEAVVATQWIFILLGLIGIVYGALVAWVQTDMKKLVAYSSVSHLGYCVVGFACLNLKGMQGSILQMLNHGISTAALFFIVGALYDRRHTRAISEFGGLAKKLPVFSFVFLVFTLSSIGLPLTNGFIGEFIILLGSFEYMPIVGLVAVTGVVLGAMYMLSLYRRVVFGEVTNKKNEQLQDLSFRECVVFAPLMVLVFFIGLYPQPLLKGLEPASRTALAYVGVKPEAAPAKINDILAPQDKEHEVGE